MQCTFVEPKNAGTKPPDNSPSEDGCEQENPEFIYKTNPMTGKRFKHFFHVPRNRLVFRPEASINSQFFRSSERMKSYTIDDLIPTNFGSIPEEEVVSQMAHDVTTQAKQQVYRAMAQERAKERNEEAKANKSSTTATKHDQEVTAMRYDL